MFIIIDACRTTQKLIIQKLKNLEDNKIIRKLDTIINLLTNAETQSLTVDETHLLPNFPLSTLEEFFKLEADLKIDREIRKQFVSIFLYIYLLFHTYYRGLCFINLIRNK